MSGVSLLGLTPMPLAGQAPAPDQLPPAPNFTVRRAPGPIKVDGTLDDAGWQGAEEIALDWEIAPGDNVRPAARTICRVTYDGETLYLGFHAQDPSPSGIRAHLTERDNVNTLVADDLVGAYIDPFNDQRRAFIFIVNPLGVQADGVRSVAGQSEDYSWDATWSSAGRKTADGYEVEIGIPFKSLRFPRGGAPQTWGFVFVRSWPRNVRYRMEAAPYDRRSSCDLCQANKVSGFEGIAPGRNIEIAPTLTGRRTDVRDPFPGGPLATGDTRPQLGGDVHWGVTPSLSVNATINPDFSQVEADVAQLDVNKRFALFYPEKRPFFLEGADFFTTPVQAVFTRTVADPDGGLKITGKVGGSSSNAIGVFAARDRLTNLLFPSNQASDATSLDQDVWTTVGRFRRDLGTSSVLGLLYAGRFGPGYVNQVGGVDGSYQLGRSTRLNVQYLGSVTEYPDSVAAAHAQPRSAFTGGALGLDLNHRTDHWEAAASYSDLSPEFRADAGFIPRVDTRTLSLRAAPVSYRSRGWYYYLSVGPFGSQTRTHDGTITDQDLGLALSYQGPMQAQVSLQLFNHQERYLGVLYHLDRMTGYVDVKPGAGIDLTAQWQIGDAIDYTNGREAAEVTITPSVQAGLGRGLILDVSNSYQRLTDRGSRIFAANILQSKIAYNFSARTQIRAIVQYRDVDRDPARYVIPIDRAERSVLGQFLFSYRVNPQTVLFLGYSENSLGTQSYDLTRTDRTFFAKVGYAWRP